MSKVQMHISMDRPWRKWYSTAGWHKKRNRQLQACPLCVYCNSIGRVSPATVADHVVPHRGNAELFWKGELQSLCDTCHSSVKQKQEVTGVLVGCDKDGIPVDSNHHWR